MGKTLLRGLLVGCIACVGCSSGGGGDGSGGSAGRSGENTAVEFDADKALEVGPTAAGAVAIGVRLGGIVSNVLSTLGSGLLAASPDLAPKVIVPGFCATGSADVDVQPPLELPGSLEAGDVVTLTLQGCAGSPVSTDPANGTIVLEMVDVGGGLPVIGGIIEAIATLDLTIDPDTTITGSFVINANLPNFSLANLTFGENAQSDRITVTEGLFQAEIACFDIFQRVGLAGPGIEFFRPRGVLKQGTEVFTLNDFNEAPPNIGFSFAGFDATPESGSLTLDSGDLSGSACGVFGNPTPNDSFVTATFTGGGCVDLEGMDTEGVPFSLTTVWDEWLDAGQPGTPSDECDGAGGSGGSTTQAAPGPATCDFATSPPQGDLVTFADTYIRGSGPEGDFRGDNYGNAGNLLIKTVSNHAFTRKIYLVFDLPDDLDPGSFSSASLILTLQRHVFDSERDPSLNGPQPTNVYGIVDGNDWDGVDPPEVDEVNGLNWNNAPKNITAAANESQFASDGVELLISNYTFDLGLGPADPPNSPDPEGTRYSLDVTQYIKDRLADTMDTDKVINLMLAIQLPDFRNADGSTFFSKEIAAECDRPFLHFE